MDKTAELAELDERIALAKAELANLEAMLRIRRTQDAKDASDAASRRELQRVDL